MKVYSFKMEVERNGMRIQDYANYSNFINTLTNLKRIRNKNVYHLDLPKGQRNSWIPFCLCKEWGNPSKIEESVTKYNEICHNIKFKNFYVKNIEQTRNWRPNGKEDIYTTIYYSADEPMDDILKEILKVFNAEGIFS